MRTLRIQSQYLSCITYSSVHYIYHVVHYVPSTYLCYNWKLHLLAPFLQFPPPPLSNYFFNHSLCTHCPLLANHRERLDSPQIISYLYIHINNIYILIYTIQRYWDVIEMLQALESEKPRIYFHLFPAYPQGKYFCLSESQFSHL